MSEFTPGPWSDVLGMLVDGSRIVATCECECYVLGSREPAQFEAPANARLIAAAPEMFELLREYEAAWSVPQGAPFFTDFAKRVRALIAKIQPFGPNTHAGVWISKDTSDKISSDGP